ncbi:unnamed protein product, partial [Polarella glacialis]
VQEDALSKTIPVPAHHQRQQHKEETIPVPVVLAAAACQQPPQAAFDELVAWLRSLSELDRELLLSYGFCFNTSPVTTLLNVTNEKRILKVCIEGLDPDEKPTDKDTSGEDSEIALAEEPVAIAGRLSKLRTSLAAIKPY